MPHIINKKIKITIYISLVLLLTSTNNLRFNELKKDFFIINNIKINGLNEKLTNEIRYKLDKHLESNLFFLNKKKVQTELNKFPFIENYSIFKKYPTEMIVNVKETKLIAKTFNNNSIKYIGFNGKVIEKEYYDSKKDLPSVFGKFKPKELLNIYLLLEENNFILDEISEFYYYNGKRWDINLTNNLIIRLPTTEVDNAIKIAKKIIESKKIDANKIIDLRVANQVIITDE